MPEVTERTRELLEEARKLAKKLKCSFGTEERQRLYRRLYGVAAEITVENLRAAAKENRTVSPPIDDCIPASLYGVKLHPSQIRGRPRVAEALQAWPDVPEHWSLEKTLGELEESKREAAQEQAAKLGYLSAMIPLPRAGTIETSRDGKVMHGAPAIVFGKDGIAGPFQNEHAAQEWRDEFDPLAAVMPFSSFSLKERDDDPTASAAPAHPELEYEELVKRAGDFLLGRAELHAIATVRTTRLLDLLDAVKAYKESSTCGDARRLFETADYIRERLRIEGQEGVRR